jgi:hypothetical protein
MTLHAGGCLCGALRYETLAEPIRVTLCHCRFCQRATGSAYMVEPVFRLEDLRITRGSPKIYERPSDGSGKIVRAHFCPDCGTKLYLSFERFPDVCGVYAGTFDDPNWFEIRPDNAKQIFIDAARPDSVLMPALPTFGQHATHTDGTPIEPAVYAQPQVVGRRSVK